MKQFKPFDKVLYRNSNSTWIPDFYACSTTSGFHFTIGDKNPIPDKNILPYQNNKCLVGTCDEPEEEIILKKEEFILCSDSITILSEGRGSVLKYKEIVENSIATMNNFGYAHCIPMSKYNPDNLEETRKWILTVKNGKLVKINK